VINLTDDVEGRIRDRIVGGDVGPGDKLPSESELREEFGVSRTVIREAISRLQAAGLVETYHGKGTFVLVRPSDEPFSPDAHRIRTAQDRVELLELRTGLEVEAAALAASRRTPAQLAAIAGALESFRHSRSKPSATLDADFRFHLAIAAATANRYFPDLLASLGPTMIAMPQTRLRAPGEAARDPHFERVVVEHEAIYSGIERQDGRAAAAAMRTHLASSRTRLTGRAG
jgi:GntR family transcriptional regulator, transcriptional repressor for pyruvate dehydrogenase complex